MGGLAAATAFVRLGAHVRVFEKSSAPFTERGSSLGFCDVALWQALTGRRMIRRGQQASRSQGAFMYGDLWEFLAEGLEPGVISFGQHVLDLGDPQHPTVQGERYDLAVIADGGWSELRSRYFSSEERPTYAGFQGWRFKVPLSAVPGWNTEGEFSHASDFVIMMKIAKNNGEDWIMGGAAIAEPESEVTKPSAGWNRQADGMDVQGTPAWFMDYFRARFGYVRQGELVRVMEAAARTGKITPNPQYEFCASRVVQGALVLVGDSAHMGTPRTATGAHTAVLDGAALFNTFQPLLRADVGGKRGGWSELAARGLKLYEPAALHRAQGLYQRSLTTSLDVLPRGWTREDAVTPMTIERARSLSVLQLKNELYVRRVSLAGLKEKEDLVQALLTAARLVPQE